MKLTWKTAWLLAILLIFGSSFARIKITFGSMQKQLNTIFENGIDKDGFSIAYDINEKMNTSRNCATIARKYDSVVSDSLIDNLEHTADLLFVASSVKERRQLEAELDTAFEALTEALLSVSLSDKDAAYVTGFIAEYKASQDRINRDPYHEKALEIEQKTSGWFPELLQKLTGSTLEIYQIGGEGDE